MRHTGFPQVDGGQRDPREMGRHKLVKKTNKSKENKIDNFFQQFEKLSLGENPKFVEHKINPFEPRDLKVKSWKL